MDASLLGMSLIRLLLKRPGGLDCTTTSTVWIHWVSYSNIPCFYSAKWDVIAPMNGSGHTFLENKPREPHKAKSQSLDCPWAFHVVSLMLSTVMAEVRWDEPCSVLACNNSQCQADKSLVPWCRGDSAFICRRPYGTSVLFLWLVSTDLRNELQRKSECQWHICRQRGHSLQSAAEQSSKRASLATASSAQWSPRRLLGPCLFLTTWFETYVMDQSILHFLMARLGSHAKVSTPLQMSKSDSDWT